VALIPTGLGVGGLALFLWLIVACPILIIRDRTTNTDGSPHFGFGPQARADS
jgi:hypothetical protein